MAGLVNQNVKVTTSQILQGAGKVTVDGYDVGGFVGGVSINRTQSLDKVKSDCQPGTVDTEITDVGYTVSFELEEATLENLAIAQGMNSSSVASGASSKVLNLIAPTSTRNVELVLQGMSGTNRSKIRTYSFPVAVSMGNTGTTLKRGTKQTVKVEFEILQGSDGSFGTWTDATV